MEFDHLRGFYFVARLGSFTEAAARLYLSQPAISLQVKALEKELGERLFDRVGRKIRLTHAGELLYVEAEGLLAKLEELEGTVRELKSLERGRLGLGASDTTSIYFLPGLLKCFRQAYPGVEVSISSVMSPQVVRKVLDRDVDLGIVTLSKAALELEVIPLFGERLVCIVSPDHAFAARKVVGAEELAAQPLILLEKGSVTRERVDGFFASVRSPLRPIMELSNFEIIKRYVAAGLGVSFVPEAALEPHRDGVRSVALRPELSVMVGAVFRKDRKLSHPARTFLSMAQEYFRVTPGARGCASSDGKAVSSPAVPADVPRSAQASIQALGAEKN